MNLPNEIVETLLSRSTASVLRSYDFSSADNSALFALNRLFENYLQTIIQRSMAFAKTNKRLKVTHDDIELSLFMQSISLSALESELLRLNNGSSKPLEFITSTEKVARGFESIDKKIQAQLLGPELNGRARGVPDYMEKGMILPNLPPLYTHYKSPIYVDRVTDDLAIREGVTRESALIEEPLRRILEIEETTKIEKSSTTTDDDDTSEERITNVMVSSITPAEKQRRLREKVFRKAWQDMGYGLIPASRAVNWETSAESASLPRRVAQV